MIMGNVTHIQSYKMMNLLPEMIESVTDEAGFRLMMLAYMSGHKAGYREDSDEDGLIAYVELPSGEVTWTTTQERVMKQLTRLLDDTKKNIALKLLRTNAVAHQGSKGG